jgi:hypothetical protein
VQNDDEANQKREVSCDSFSRPSQRTQQSLIPSVVLSTAFSHWPAHSSASVGTSTSKSNFDIFFRFDASVVTSRARASIPSQVYLNVVNGLRAKLEDLL